ncbi:cation-translocating P-type ATPase [Horticoccus sp. 23ND18S-11]|uniref:cation-translocating P-type ATPase n=1 Tax=Horticoccus sp. 23ND18S-11 TaxID=3391832 RepID=UPI0039C9AF99
MKPPLSAPPPVAAEPWHCHPVAVVLNRLQSGEAGLSPVEAAARLAANGPNELVETARTGPWLIFARQFKSLIIVILIAAGGVSAVLGQTVDAIAILAIVLLNAAIGFHQEYNAEKSIAALKRMTAPRATVRRGGQIVSIPARDIVVGDILTLEAGDLIAADARLFQSASLTCIEAALTGESDVQAKTTAPLTAADIPLGDRVNLVFMGTSVATGTGQAVVVATAMASELGRIAGLITDAASDPGTPLQRKLDAVGRILIWVTLGIVLTLFAIGLARGNPPLELFMTAVGLAVAAVPEGLPAVVTVALSLGVLRLARHRALVRSLPAVETLGSTSVICTDKTGTLTVGEMTARVLYVAGRSYDVTGEGYGPEGAVHRDGKKLEASDAAPLLELASVLLGCNHAQLAHESGAWKTIGDPTEGALLVAGVKAGGDRARLEREWPAQREYPFDSDRKLSSVLRLKPDGTPRLLVNGAPGKVLDRCTGFLSSTGIRPLTASDRTAILAQTTALAGRALRVLASAHRDFSTLPAADATAETLERDLVFVGLTGMYDPPRPEARDAVAKCHAAGIRVVMITGDHPQTALTIAHELGLAVGTGPAVTGAELDALSDADLKSRVAEIAVYARVTAAHKLRIIRAWKANGAVVAMTGDGVNDAPAIKGADIGIAMGRTGTEVTKQAAHMIITDDNFATIVSAVETGRGIYDNIRKTLQYLLAGNTGEVLFMTVCVTAGLPAPLLPIHLLWINLVTDGLPALCLATDAVDHRVMQRRPRPRTIKLTDRGFLRTMVLTGVLTAGVAFAVFHHLLKTQPLETARAAAFAVLVFAELLRSFGARSETTPVWRISLRTNLKLVLVVLVSCGLQFWSQHNDTLGRFLHTGYMSLADGLVLLALGAIPLAALEAVKQVRNLRHARALSSRTHHAGSH